ncbi:MAG: germination protein YpeB [Oscillospiraceae bacterium]|nr:germination protein YpeB [Oscillospiraceae bacterium]
MRKNGFKVFMVLITAVAVLFFGISILSEQSRKGNLINENLREFTRSIDNITLCLERISAHGEDAQLGAEAEELYERIQSAKENFGRLSLKTNAKNLEKFLSQAENFALSLTKKAILSEGIADTDLANLQSLTLSANEISGILSYENEESSNDNPHLKMEDKISLVEENVLIKENTLIYKEDVEKSIEVIYEPPFSRVTENGDFTYLARAPQISEYTAKNIIAQILGEKVYESEYVGESDASSGLYIFETENTSFCATKKGGKLAYLVERREVTQNTLGYNECLLKAEEFLLKTDFKGMEATHHSFKDNVYNINFVYRDGQTLCYGDLIKISIAADNGEVILFDSRGFLANNKSRAFKTAEFSKAQAQEKIRADLKIESSAVVLLPNDENSRCYEFFCTDSKGRKLFIYINVDNLEEEAIFIYNGDGGI